MELARVKVIKFTGALDAKGRRMLEVPIYQINREEANLRQILCRWLNQQCSCFLEDVINGQMNTLLCNCLFSFSVLCFKDEGVSGQLFLQVLLHFTLEEMLSVKKKKKIMQLRRRQTC